MARWSARPTCRLSVFQAGHIPSWRGSCERYALSPVAAGSRWLLLLLSPLLSAPIRGAGAGRDQALRMVRESHPSPGLRIPGVSRALPFGDVIRASRLVRLSQPFPGPSSSGA
jgi:hypothetical protein